MLSGVSLQPARSSFPKHFRGLHCCARAEVLHTRTSPVAVQHVVEGSIQCHTGLLLDATYTAADAAAVTTKQQQRQQQVLYAESTSGTTTSSTLPAPLSAGWSESNAASSQDRMLAGSSALTLGAPGEATEQPQTAADAPQLCSHPVQHKVPAASVASAASAASVSKEHQKNVVRSLRACGNAGELLEVTKRCGSSMDGQSVTACFTAAARLAQSQMLEPWPQTQQQQQQQQLDSLLQQVLVPLLQQKLPHLDATGLVLVMYSLAVCKHTAEPVLADLEQALVAAAPQLSPALMSKLLWAFSSLGLVPVQQLQLQILAASYRQLPAFNDQDCAMLLQAAVKLQMPLPHRWLEKYCCRLEQLCDQLSGQSLCVILHSLASLTAMTRATADSNRAGRHASGGHSSPVPIFVGAGAAAAAEAAVGSNRTSASAAAAAAAMTTHASHGSLAFRLPDRLMYRLLQASQSQLQHMSPVGLNMLSNALQKLQVDPHDAWQAAFVAATCLAMPNCDARNAAVLAVPLARWKCQPPRQWMEQYLGVTGRGIEQMQPQGLSVLGHSLAALHAQPDKPWLLAYARAALDCQAFSTPAGCSSLMHTLGTWQPLKQAAAAAAVAAQRKCRDQQRQPTRPPTPAATAEQEVAHSVLHAAVAAPAGTGATAAAAAAAAACRGFSQSPQQPQWQMHQKNCLPQQQQHHHHHQQQQQQPQYLQQQEEELGVIVWSLAQQCICCFMERGDQFTAEQLGMFCKGLAGLKAQGSKRLARRLHQVVSVLLQQPQQLTAMTVTNILLVLATTCPAPAAPRQLLQQLWSHLVRVCSSTGTAAATVWAGNALASQPSRVEALQLLRMAAGAAKDATLPQLAELLQQVALGAWPIEQDSVQELMQQLLQKQAAAVAAAADVQGSIALLQEQQQQQQELEDQLQDVRTEPSHYGSSSGISSGQVDANGSSSSSSNQAAAVRLFGLANHRLRAAVAATAALAAWAGVMPLASRSLALCNCEQLLRELGWQQMPLELALHVCCLATGVSSGRQTACTDCWGGEEQQSMQLPPGLAAMLQGQREQFMAAAGSKAPSEQQQWAALRKCLLSSQKV